MQAAVVPAVNSPWEIRDIPQPEAGPNQVLVKMHASGVCYSDVHETLGHLPGSFPRVLGHEPVGEIVAIGPGVTSRKVGDRVGTTWVQKTCGRCEWCLRGKKNFCPKQEITAIHLQGGHAEYMPMYADATMLIPDSISYEQAAPIFCAGYTVWGGLRWAKPQPHERVAVVGIGGLGHLAVQYAKAAGFETIAISHSPDKDKLIRELGADEIVRDGKERGPQTTCECNGPVRMRYKSNAIAVFASSAPACMGPRSNSRSAPGAAQHETWVRLADRSSQRRAELISKRRHCCTLVR